MPKFYKLAKLDGFVSKLKKCWCNHRTPENVKRFDLFMQETSNPETFAKAIEREFPNGVPSVWESAKSSVWENLKC